MNLIMHKPNINSEFISIIDNIGVLQLLPLIVSH